MNPITDPLALASETPDVAALINEFTLAQQNVSCNIGNVGAAEDVRYNRWRGKSAPPDGCKWQKNQVQGEVVRPYDGRPDTDVQLTDEIALAEVDAAMMALAMAQFGARTTNVSRMTAAQVGELKAVATWVRNVVQEDLLDDGELAAQMMANLGWTVLNPGWLSRTELVERDLDLESFIAQAAQAWQPAQAGPGAGQGFAAAASPEEYARDLSSAILDEQLEDAATQEVQRLFAYLPKGRARQIVRDLRSTGEAKFLDRQEVEKRPCVRTLIQGYNYFVSGAVGKIGKARGHLVTERLFEADLRAIAADNNWNADFVEAVIKTAGMFSAFSEAQKEKNIRSEEDAADRSIEIWTTHLLQFDEETGAAGIYCTTFSPHLKPSVDGTTPAYYATHYLLDFAHGEAPFVEARREVIGPSMADTRGVPEMVRSDQKVIKNLQDASVARAHLEVDPPRFFTGMGGTKIANWNSPGGKAESIYPNADVKDMGPKSGNISSAEMMIDRVYGGTHRRFALPNTSDGSHPSGWQMRQLRASKRWLGAWERVFWQMVVLTYQEMDPLELAMIIGRPPQLTVQDILRHRVTLSFDARALDQDWMKTVLDFVIQLLGIDSGGLMDRGPIIQLALAYIDPAIVNTVMRDQSGASAALYRQVEQDIASIMDFNPPQLRENDASAGMQMQMAFAVIGKNPVYQQKAAQIPMIQENLKTYMQNLQHNVQETQISPQQGRLGVQAQPQVPVQSGPPQLGNGGGGGY